MRFADQHIAELAGESVERGRGSSMTTGPSVTGRICFRDLRHRKDAEFVVQADQGKAEIMLSLDEDVAALGGFYSGECSVGMEATQAGVLVRVLRKAVGRLTETGQGPSVIGRVTLKWI